MSSFSNLRLNTLPVTRYVAGFSFLLMSFAAQAGIFDDDEARKAILDLRQQISSLNATVNNNLTAAQQRSNEEIAQLRKSMLELQNQIDRQKGDISQLRGDNEVLTRNLADMQIRQKDLVQTSEQKLKAIEQRSQAVEQKLIKIEPVNVTLDGHDFMADPLEKHDFDAAFALFKDGDFVKSQKAFFDFVQRYPSSGYLSSALYWLANARYSNRDYKEAIINFRSMISKKSDHLRVPEALLAIANCQLEMKDPKSAKKTLEELMKKYPKSEAALVGVERLLTLK